MLKEDRYTKKISKLFRVLGQPTRLRILLAIGEGEACVCHLEAVLGQRQAYISQHLMALRNAKILATRRDGRFIFYRLRDPKLLDLVDKTAQFVGVAEAIQQYDPHINESLACVCPKCDTETSRVVT